VAWILEACKPNTAQRRRGIVADLAGYPYKRSHLVALRQTKISASDPPSIWWPGERD
jgi:hypothetical protein